MLMLWYWRDVNVIHSPEEATSRWAEDEGEWPPPWRPTAEALPSSGREAIALSSTLPAPPLRTKKAALHTRSPFMIADNNLCPWKPIFFRVEQEGR